MSSLTRAAAIVALAFAARLALCQVPVSAELQVNQNHGGYQEAPAVALAQDGSALVVYQGLESDTKELRLLDPSGLPVGEVQYPGQPVGDGGGETQALAALRTGLGALCLSNSNQVLCRKIDTRTGLAGPPFAADSAGSRDVAPAVALLPDGRIGVAWLRLESDATGTSIRHLLFRCFDANGMPLNESVELASLRDELGTGVAIAALGADRFGVVWFGWEVDGDQNGVAGTLVSPAGGVLVPTFQVNHFVTGDQQTPAIAADAAGNFVVVWESVYQDGSLGGIYGQRFDARGAMVDGEFQVSSDSNSDQVQPAVAMDQAGNFVVAFYGTQESPELAEDTLIRAYSKSGAPLGPQVVVNDQIIYEQQHPAVALSDSGLIQVAYDSWRGPGPGEPEGDFNPDVMTRRFVLPCVADESTLCLQGDRFAVRAFWQDFEGAQGIGWAVPLTQESGGFWFFADDNFELLVKVLDGCGVNQRFWTFAAGLTDVLVDLLVTDTWTGQVEVFHNALGTPFLPVLDTGRFDSCSAAQLRALGKPLQAAEARARAEPSAGASATCVAGPTAMCLNDHRFQVRAHWQEFTGLDGEAIAVPFGDDSGLLWFFWSTNLELAVKVLDGCGVNGRYWVYAAGLTNVAVTLTVEDTIGGGIWQRQTTLGQPFPPILDSSAFGACP